MRIDAHVHCTDPAALLTGMLDKLGLDKAVVCSSGVARGETIKTLEDAKAAMGGIARAQSAGGVRSVSQVNRALAEVVNGNGERCIGFAKLDLFSPTLRQDAEEAVSLGFAGFGEIIGIHGNADKVDSVLSLADDAGLPVFIHCDYPVDAADLGALFQMIRRYARAKVVVGHMGGDFYLDALEQAAGLQNAYVDTSEVVNQVALQVAASTMPERLLYASDFPFDCAESMLCRIDCLALDAAVKERVMGLNALELLDLS
ncbi:MAG: amidohydrolase family protein [Bacillota bacterium]